MNHAKTLLLAATAYALSGAVAPAFQVYSFANLGGGEIQFNGAASSFQFINDLVTGNQWSITDESGGSGALNLNGWFSGGPWSYGSVVHNGAIQSATVGPTSATLSIDDGTGTLATARVSWVDISTYFGVGGFNAGLTVNLTDLSYAGGNEDLKSFFSEPAGTLNFSFQFNPVQTLDQLSSGAGPYQTSFSGTLTPVPEPNSLPLIGVGLVLLGGWSFRRRSLHRSYNCISMSRR